MRAPAAAEYLSVSESALRGLPIKRRKIGALRAYAYDRLDLDEFADKLPYEGEEQERGNSCDSLFGASG